MRDFFWNVFALTGSIDAYLMYKGVGGFADDPADGNREDEERDEEELH